VLVLAAGTLRAQDAPHWTSARFALDCTTQCHTLHDDVGGSLTQAASNAELCQSCHNPDPGSLAQDLPVANADRAVPGLDGIHHAYGVLADNSAAGALPPTDPQRALRVMDGMIVCSTCHNQHKSEQAFGGTARVGSAHPFESNGGNGVLAASGTFAGPEGVWYLVEIVATGTETSARFRYSKDNGTSWFPTGCAPGSLGTCLTADGATPVTLDSGVAVSFAGAAAGDFPAGNRWEISAAYPFLRWASPPGTLDPLIDSGDNSTGVKFCRDCHDSWVMATAEIRSGDGVTSKSHPVGVTIPATTAYYGGTPRDGNGAAQGGAGDGNPTNDLRRDLSGFVQCMSCHGVHYTDSNTLSVDGP